MRGTSVIQGFCRYSGAAMRRNSKFQIRDNELSERGSIERVALWINKECVKQAWQTDLEALREYAKKRHAKYIIRDMSGKSLEVGDFSREGGKNGKP